MIRRQVFLIHFLYPIFVAQCNSFITREIVTVGICWLCLRLSPSIVTYEIFIVARNTNVGSVSYSSALSVFEVFSLDFLEDVSSGLGPFVVFSDNLTVKEIV